MKTEIELLFDKADELWAGYCIDRRNLDLELIKWSFNAIQENFKKYPELERVIIEVNTFYTSEGEEEANVSISVHPDSERPDPDEQIDNEVDIEQAMFYVVDDRLDDVEEDTILTRDSTLEDLMKAMGRA